MAIDPSIITEGLRPLSQINPLEIYGQVAQIAALRDQGEARRLAGEEARTKHLRQQHVEDVYRRAITTGSDGKPKIDYELLLSESGLPGDLRPAVLTQMQEDEQRALELHNTRLTADEKKTNFLASAARTVIEAKGNPLIWGVELLAAKRLGVIDEPTHNALARLQDPQEILGRAQSYVARAGGAEAAKPQLVTHVPTSGPFAGQTVQEFVPPTTGAQYVQAPKDEDVSYQREEALLDGKRAFVFFHPKKMRYFNAAGEDVTARVVPIPPQSAVTGGDGQWNPRLVATFNQIAGAYERSPLSRAADRTIVLKDAVKAARQDPKNAAQQLTLAYSFIQALDTYQSAVREGELQNLGMLGTRAQQLALEANRVISSGAFLPPAVVTQIADSADQLVKTIEAGRAQKLREFASRARVSGVGDMWNEFVAGFTGTAAPPPPDSTTPRPNPFEK
jgi:hypothetical protein